MTISDTDLSRSQHFIVYFISEAGLWIWGEAESKMFPRTPRVPREKIIFKNVLGYQKQHGTDSVLLRPWHKGISLLWGSCCFTAVSNIFLVIA